MTLDHATIVDLLEGLDLFTSLSDEELDALADKVDTVSWEPGTTGLLRGRRGRLVLRDRQRLGEADAPAGRRLADHARAGRPGRRSSASSRCSRAIAARRRWSPLEPTTAVAISREDLMAILENNAQAAISMAVHVAGLLQTGRRAPLRHVDVDGQRADPRDAAGPGRGASGAPPGEENVELVGSADGPRAARRHAQGRRDTAAALARERGDHHAQARPDHRPLAGGPEGATRLSRRVAAAGAALALSAASGVERPVDRSSRARPGGRAPGHRAGARARRAAVPTGRDHRAPCRRARARTRTSRTQAVQRLGCRARDVPAGEQGRLRPLRRRRGRLPDAGRRHAADLVDRRIPRPPGQARRHRVGRAVGEAARRRQRGHAAHARDRHERSGHRHHEGAPAQGAELYVPGVPDPLLGGAARRP